MHNFKVGQNVIGLGYPDLVPAIVISLIRQEWVEIYFVDKGKEMHRTVNFKRLKLIIVK